MRDAPRRRRCGRHGTLRSSGVRCLIPIARRPTVPPPPRDVAGRPVRGGRRPAPSRRRSTSTARSDGRPATCGLAPALDPPLGRRDRYGPVELRAAGAARRCAACAGSTARRTPVVAVVGPSRPHSPGGRRRLEPPRARPVAAALLVDGPPVEASSAVDGCDPAGPAAAAGPSRCERRASRPVAPLPTRASERTTRPRRPACGPVAPAPEPEGGRSSVPPSRSRAAGRRRPGGLRRRARLGRALRRPTRRGPCRGSGCRRCAGVDRSRCAFSCAGVAERTEPSADGSEIAAGRDEGAPGTDAPCELREIPAATYSPRGLPPKYHRRGRSSLPCSEWERVFPRRNCHRKPGFQNLNFDKGLPSFENSIASTSNKDPKPSAD